MSIFSNNLLDKEIEEGNIEYKRCLTNIDDRRREEFISQMLWRIKEGNGEAIYYLGVEDDGTFYNWNKNEIKQTIESFKKIVSMAKLKIVRITKNYYTNNQNKKNYYLKVVIRENQRLLPEKRIFLFGESGIGKTTFLANLICNRIDEEARLYLLNHKHEMIEKKTSSFNYNHIIYDDIKWVFIEGPGDDKYKKTRNKLLLSFGSSIDLCVFVEEWKWKDYYIDILRKMDIPYITINIHNHENRFPLYNCKQLIDKNEFFSNIKSLCKSTKVSDELEYVVLQYFTNPDVGIILSGILKTGTLIENKKYLLFLNNKSYDITVKSIHIDSKPINKISGPKTVSLSIQFNEENVNVKNLMGIITNKYLDKTLPLEEELNGKHVLIYKDNRCFTTEHYKNYYQTNDKILIVDNIS